MGEKKLSAQQDKELLGCLEDDLKDQATASLMAFTLYTKPDYKVSWHHEKLAETLDEFISDEGGLDRLMVFMPPRHGKSELATRRLGAYYLGKYPDDEIIMASYAHELAADMNKDVQRIIETPAYAHLFPETKLGAIGDNGIRYTRNVSKFEILGKKGKFKSAGIGSGIMGMGANLGIIDDPFKDDKEAESKTYRDRAWKWYNSTFSTRLEKNAKVLLIMTRWHQDDLAGRLLDLAESDPEADQWTVISFPAIKEDDTNPDDPRDVGEALWPWKYDEAALKKTKKSRGSRVWNSLYQQRPASIEGAIIQKIWLEKFYDETPNSFDEVIQSWDLAFKKGTETDFVCGQVWGRIGAEFFLLDQTRERLSFTETISAIKALTKKWPEAMVKIIEDKANGPAVISTLENEIVGIIPYLPDRSKEARVHAVSPLFEARNVVLPSPMIAPWIRDYIDELTSFPYGVNDDQVDATSQALLRFQNESVGQWTSKMNEGSATIAGSISGGDEW